MGQASEPAAQLEHRHARFQPDLAADQIQLVLLRLIERGGVLPVAARILHPFAQHGFIEVVAQIVMFLGDLRGPRSPLAVPQAALQDQPQRGPLAHVRA